jgi:hypothetical protein
MTKETIMPVMLTGEQESQLRAAIVAALSPGDLALVVHDHVRDELHNLTGPGTYPQQVFELIGACRQRGWLDRLVLGVIAERGGNPAVIEFARRAGLHPAGPPGGVEKLVGPNIAMVDLQPWLHRCGVLGARVCQVRVSGQRATGFLVGPDAVLTNHHVVVDALDNPGALSFVFDHARTISGHVHPGVTFLGKRIIAALRGGPEGQWHDPLSAVLGEDELDVALVQLREPAGTCGIGDRSNGRPRGWIEISAAPYDFAGNAGLAILQHPLGEPVKLALDFADRGSVVAAGRRVRYSVPTQPGSSGSPVFAASSLALVALHHGGRDQFNQGIPISVIAEHPAVKEYLAGVPASP